ncbi:MAG: nucleotidyl transferase AbiEii/AbiGii toxin family protein [Actinomycetes bacterium]
MLAVLDRHGVHYVLIGGYAATVHGARRPTQDIDITPASTAENLFRLIAALRELRAGIRVDNAPEGLPFDTSVAALRGVRVLNLRTPYGDIDLTFEPAGTHGFDDLMAHALIRDVDGVVVHVASLDDVIRSKEAAGRAKDDDALPELYRLAHKQHRARADE